MYDTNRRLNQKKPRISRSICLSDRGTTDLTALSYGKPSRSLRYEASLAGGAKNVQNGAP